MLYESMTTEQLQNILKDQMVLLDKYASDDVNIDMTRGKPGKDQLDISEGILNTVNCNSKCFLDDGTDCRNYGIFDGIQPLKELFSDLFGIDKENIIATGNSSLTLMYDTVARAYTFGFCDSIRPWSKEEKIKFICLTPGYDRHFAISQLFGMEMISVPLCDDGPDMDLVRKYVENDSAVKGMWCVPKYSNPSGIVYSDDIIRQIANLKPAAPDFRLIWDNAYGIHDFYERIDILNIIDECEKSGRPNMPIMFFSTSKITFPGGGVSFLAASKENIEFIKKQLSVQTIGPDKVNQLRHVKFFKNKQGMLDHMKRHAQILAPKFEAVLDVLKKELSDTGVAKWSEPKGGYFISFDSLCNCASDIYELCIKAGVKLTKVGATHPYGIDQENKNIRIAPSNLSVEQIQEAAERFALCVKIASINKIISSRT